MGETVDRTGTFRAEIISYGMKEYKSGTISIDLCFRLTDWWYTGEEGTKWWDWSTYGQEVYGHFYVITKAGEVNRIPVEQLVTHCGWDGNFESIEDGTWEPTPCQVSVNAKTHEGNTKMEVDWVNAYGDEPKAGMQTLSAEKTKSLQSKYGGQIRALVGNKIRQDAKPTGPPPTAPPKTATAPGVAPEGGDPIPF